MNILDVTNFALERIYDACSPRARTPHQHYECDESPRMDRMSDIEERRTIQHWLCTRPTSEDIIVDILADLDFERILANFAAGDDAENGRLIARRIRELRDTVNNDDEYWRAHE